MSKTPHHRSINPRLRTFAKDMRGDSTDAEAKMWQLLRGRRLSQFKFRRQAPIENYILDFVCFEKRLVVEIDGGQHASSTRDVIRDQMLASLGFIVARYWNNDVLQNPASVLDDLYQRLLNEAT